MNAAYAWHRLLAGGAAEMGGAEEIHVGGEVLAQQLEPEPSPPLRALGRAAVEALLRLGLDAADLAEEFRRHGETLAGAGPILSNMARTCIA